MSSSNTQEFHVATAADNRLQPAAIGNPHDPGRHVRGAAEFAGSLPDHPERVVDDLFGKATQVLSRLPEARGPVEVDLSRVANADSATLAVLIAWAAHAQERGGTLRFLNAPAGLRNLARLSDLDALLLGAAA